MSTPSVPRFVLEAPERRPGRARRVALVAGAVVVALVAGGLGWRAVTTAPAGTPEAVEWSDARISDDLASATVLGLGEATHSTAEFHEARAQLLGKLAQRGFTTVAIEEDAGTATAVDAWVQGGPGTLEEATKRFGFGIYHTQGMADLLAYARAWNEGHPEAERIRFYGVDEPRPDADKAVALGWLATVDEDAARTLGVRLEALTDDTWLDKATNEAAKPAVADLLAAVERAAATRGTDEAAFRALLSARALAQGRERATSTQADLRDRNMAEQLAAIVEHRAAQGGRHTLLFGHNGHIDKGGVSSAMPGKKLGQLSAERWGAAYKAIGTEGHHVGLMGEGGPSSITVDSPVRGIFAGTRVGYLELATASQGNRAVLARRMPSVSAGWPFAAWQAWVPPMVTVEMAPSEAWDALLYYETARPAVRLP